MADRGHPWTQYLETRQLCSSSIQDARKDSMLLLDKAIGGPLSAAVFNAILRSELDADQAVVEPDDETGEPTIGYNFASSVTDLQDLYHDIERYRASLYFLSHRLMKRIKQMEEKEQRGLEEFQRKSREEVDGDGYNYAASDFAYDAARESRAFPWRD